MATNLRLTTAGRNAVLDEDNIGTAAVTITKMALGAGSGTEGAGNDARTTLRDQRDIVAVAGATSAAGQIALRAEFNSASAYAATEMGLFARIGMGAEFLFAYWTDGGEVFINKPANLRTIVAVTVALVNSEADVEVTVSPAVSVSAVAALLDLSDAPNSYVNAARRKVAVNSAGTGVEFVEGLLPSETTAINTLITAAINALIGGAPGALDTLNELAAAIGDDADFRSTVLGLINARLTQAQVDARIRAVGGVGNLAFFSLANTINIQGESYKNLLGGRFTVGAAEEIVGLLWSGRIGGTDDNPSSMRIIRGETEIVGPIPIRSSASRWTRQLFLDKPGVAGTYDYRLQARRSAIAVAVKGSSLTIFRMPSGAQATVLSADAANAANEEVLAVSITPASAASKVRLSFFSLHTPSGLSASATLKRGSTTLISGVTDAAAETSQALAFPSNFEDWVDSPARADAQRYSLSLSTAGTMVKGSYMMAQSLG